MKTPLIPVIALLAFAPLALTSCSKDSIAAETSTAAKAGQPDTEAFLATYRKALAAKDTATLDSFLLTEGSPAEIVDFFKMMRDAAEGETTVELKTPTAEEAAKFNRAMEMPDGKFYKLPITPAWQLVVTTVSKEGGTSTSTSAFPVAVKDGKLVIPMPVPTGQAAE